MTRRTSPPPGGLSDQPDVFSVEPWGQVMHALDGARWSAHEQFLRSSHLATTVFSTCRNGSRRRSAGWIAGRVAAEVRSLSVGGELVAG